MRFVLISVVLLLASGCDSGPRGTRDAGTPLVDGGSMADGGGQDAGGESDSGAAVDAGGELDGGASLAAVDLTFSGCSPSFDGDVVVVRNGESIAVSSTSGGTLTGSIQLALEEDLGPVTLSTQHRVDSGSVINVVVGTTWTNIAMRSSEVLSGTLTDPIGGALQLRAYDEASGVIDVDFVGVTLQNPSDGTVCRVDGTLVTSGLSF
ncbi:MAG: hypothetical protein AB8I08_00235 [Sandaracinaceae bacterium]